MAAVRRVLAATVNIAYLMLLWLIVRMLVLMVWLDRGVRRLLKTRARPRKVLVSGNDKGYEARSR